MIRSAHLLCATILTGASFACAPSPQRPTSGGGGLGSQVTCAASDFQKKVSYLTPIQPWAGNRPADHQLEQPRRSRLRRRFGPCFRRRLALSRLPEYAFAPWTRSTSTRCPARRARSVFRIHGDGGRASQRPPTDGLLPCRLAGGTKPNIPNTRRI
jgi:hypothetical protein